jgi:hypothetical protein
MLKKSLLLTSCLVIGMVLSSDSFAMNKENEDPDQGKSVPRSYQMSLLDWIPMDAAKRMRWEAMCLRQREKEEAARYVLSKKQKYAIRMKVERKQEAEHKLILRINQKAKNTSNVN